MSATTPTRPSASASFLRQWERYHGDFVYRNELLMAQGQRLRAGTVERTRKRLEADAEMSPRERGIVDVVLADARAAGHLTPRFKVVGDGLG